MAHIQIYLDTLTRSVFEVSDFALVCWFAFFLVLWLLLNMPVWLRAMCWMFLVGVFCFFVIGMFSEVLKPYLSCHQYFWSSASTHATWTDVGRKKWQYLADIALSGWQGYTVFAEACTEMSIYIEEHACVRKHGIYTLITCFCINTLHRCVCIVYMALYT